MSPLIAEGDFAIIQGVKQLISLFALAVACQLSAAPVTNVVRSSGVGDVSVVCSDASDWNFTSSIDRADGREIVTVRLDSPAESVPPSFDVFFYTSGADVLQVWTPFDERCQLWPFAWGNARYLSALAYRAPVCAAFNNRDRNRCAVAASDAFHQLKYALTVDERTCRMEGRFKFFTTKESPRKSYEVKILIDRRDVFWGDAVRDAADWVSRTAGLKPADVPEAAFDPLYSSWYAFWQDIHAPVIEEEARKLLDGGHAPETPCALVLDAGGLREEVRRATLGTVRSLAGDDRPGLFVVGQVATHAWPKLGLFAGRRVLVTSSEAVQERAATAVEDLGGRPVGWPLIRLEPRPLDWKSMPAYDAIVLTSPSSVRLFFASCPWDRRRLPAFYTCGAGTDAELRRFGVASDVVPAADFSAKGLIAEIARLDLSGKRVLRLRSAKAGSAVARALRKAGARVDDVVLYDNVFCAPSADLPPFDDVFFASASAVDSFLAQYGAARLRGKGIHVMGEPTRAALPERCRRRAVTFALGLS